MTKPAYVLGFLFTGLQTVLLIRKNRPDWMAGLYNGIGGKVESGETPRQAMVREAREEADVDVPEDGWYHVCDLDLPYGLVTVYTTMLRLDQAWSTMTDEAVSSHPIFSMRLDFRSVRNVRWLVHMSAACLDLGDDYEPATVVYGKAVTS